jgi:PilZ domain
MPPTTVIVEDDGWDGVERRRAKRKLVAETVQLALPGQITLRTCNLRDLSALGAGLRLDGLGPLPTYFALSFDGFRTSLTCHLIWRDRDRGGVEFRS